MNSGGHLTQCAKVRKTAKSSQEDANISKSVSQIKQGRRCSWWFQPVEKYIYYSQSNTAIYSLNISRTHVWKNLLFSSFQHSFSQNFISSFSLDVFESSPVAACVELELLMDRSRWHVEWLRVKPINPISTTLPETLEKNITLENRPLEKEIPIGNHHFLGGRVVGVKTTHLKNISIPQSFSQLDPEKWWLEGRRSGFLVGQKAYFQGRTVKNQGCSQIKILYIYIYY